MTGAARRAGLISCIALLFCATGLQARDYDWQLGTSFSWLTGDYGEPADTDLVYIPFTAKRYFDQGDLTLTVPFVDISTGGSTAVTAGEVVAVPGLDSSSESGIGDVIVKGRYYAVEQHGAWPFIDLVLRIKLPTADEDKGLGTGETDVSFITEFSRRLNPDLFGIAELGYTWIGDPSGGDLDNRLLYSVGLGYEADAQWTLSGYLDGRTALVDGNDPPLSLLGVAEYKHRPDLRFDAMLELGLNDGAPDLGLTVGARIRL